MNSTSTDDDRINRPLVSHLTEQVKQQLKLHNQFSSTKTGASIAHSAPLPRKGMTCAVYIADLFGEVLESTPGGQLVPAIADVMNWLELVNAQCPECEPPEWLN